MLKDTTIIIPAYNEEDTIFPVALAATMVAPTIVACDGCTDRTVELARSAGAYVLRLMPNRGKTFAILAALEECETETIILLDADLLGLLPENIILLHRLYDSGHYRQTVASINLLYGMQSQTDGLWGQRCGPRSLWENVCNQTDGYSFEVVANRMAPNIGVTYWTNVRHRSKLQKFGFLEGIKRQYGMFKEIFGNDK
jgi:polyisoprenyl-phosphate glycosyltransferase